MCTPHCLTEVLVYISNAICRGPLDYVSGTQYLVACQASERECVCMYTFEILERISGTFRSLAPPLPLHALSYIFFAGKIITNCCHVSG